VNPVNKEEFYLSKCFVIFHAKYCSDDDLTTYFAAVLSKPPRPRDRSLLHRTRNLQISTSEIQCKKPHPSLPVKPDEVCTKIHKVLWTLWLWAVTNSSADDRKIEIWCPYREESLFLPYRQRGGTVDNFPKTTLCLPHLSAEATDTFATENTIGVPVC